MSARSKITAGLSELLERHLSKGSAAWGREVRIWDPSECRVDYMSVSCPNGAFARIGDIEAAKLACYEVKSCMADYRSGHGLNALGDVNYLVLPDELRRRIAYDGTFADGWCMAVPCPKDCRSFVDPVPYDGEVDGWRLHFFGCPEFLSKRRIPIAQAMWAIMCAGARKS